ncbi:MAG: hypothetical protein SVM80_01725 [Halobacteriota archaeon]|nr:hypothetical protein [Halobacteriota archaeon]
MDKLRLEIKKLDGRDTKQGMPTMPCDEETIGMLIALLMQQLGC